MKGDSLRERIEPLVHKFAEQLVEVLDAFHRERLRAVIEQLGVAAAPTSTPARTSRKAPKSKPAIAAKAARAPKTCSKCSKPGHNAKTCGRAPVASKIVRRDPPVFVTPPARQKIEVLDISTPSPPPYSSRPLPCHRSARRGATSLRGRTSGRPATRPRWIVATRSPT